MSSRSEPVRAEPVRAEPVRAEPVYDGYFADPFLARSGGEFIAYGSGDDRLLDGTETHAFEALRSPDLLHWSSAGGVLERPDPALGDAYWAPEVVAADGAYWMFYSVGHGIVGHHLRVARADSPLGPFVDQGVNLTPGESFAIDAHPFRDADGTWYLFFARDVLTGDRPGTHLAVLRLDSSPRPTRTRSRCSRRTPTGSSSSATAPCTAAASTGTRSRGRPSCGAATVTTCSSPAAAGRATATASRSRPRRIRWGRGPTSLGWPPTC
ncbi:family 43 glycosylhydrolase [Leifsonia sp. L25]|uniref:family 43 glycosylhydrolase n=1 Tax=Leifsonia sp. L25 TaxID=3423957 RepID=UPI003D69B091